MRLMKINTLRSPVRNIVVAIVFSLAMNGIGFAQEAAKAEEQAKKAIIKTLPPAYNSQMRRLAEILGAIHYLRELCDAREGSLWRDQMENIITNEEPSPERKADLISRFNRGYRTYREIYRECTPTAIEAINLYMRQGTRLAGEIPNRFGR